MSSIVETSSKATAELGIKNLMRFKNTIAKGSFKNLYIFKDGSFLKKKGKVFYRKVKSLGKPIIIISSSNFNNIPEEERRNSIAEDINNDLIWIRKTFHN